MLPKMLRDKTVAAVVPAFNEETQISRVVETMPDFVDWIVVIDDASSDEERREARAALVAAEAAMTSAKAQKTGLRGKLMRRVLKRHRVYEWQAGLYMT